MGRGIDGVAKKTLLRRKRGNKERSGGDERQIEAESADLDHRYKGGVLSE